MVEGLALGLSTRDEHVRLLSERDGEFDHQN